MSKTQRGLFLKGKDDTPESVSQLSKGEMLCQPSISSLEKVA
jgi:hypothetical protein